MYVFGARDGRPVGKPFTAAAGFVLTVSFNPVTGILASTSTDGTATVADPVTQDQVASTAEDLTQHAPTTAGHIGLS